ncbi:unnamed protein product, partial [Nesidiocoris tenuis]
MVERFARIRPTGNIRANDSCSRMNRYFRSLPARWRIRLESSNLLNELSLFNICTRLGRKEEEELSRGGKKMRDGDEEGDKSVGDVTENRRRAAQLFRKIVRAEIVAVFPVRQIRGNMVSATYMKYRRRIKSLPYLSKILLLLFSFLFILWIFRTPKREISPPARRNVELDPFFEKLIAQDYERIVSKFGAFGSPAYLEDINVTLDDRKEMKA